TRHFATAAHDGLGELHCRGQVRNALHDLGHRDVRGRVDVLRDPDRQPESVRGRIPGLQTCSRERLAPQL
ncbi:hypothetical protein BGZ54_004543, partial [Gamsiella multidivaricata]